MVPDLTHCMLASPGRERRWAWGCCFSWASASLACTQSSDSSFIRGWQCTATSEGHVGGVNDLEEVGMCGTCARSSMGPFPSLHLWACSHQTSWKAGVQFSSVQVSRSVMSDSLRPHEPQHARPPCPSPAPRVHPNPCPSSRWCHPTISSSVVPFSSCPHSFPTSGSFPMSQLFASGGQSIGLSASTSVLPMNTQDWWGRALIIGFVSLELELWKPGKSVWC